MNQRSLALILALLSLVALAATGDAPTTPAEDRSPAGSFVGRLDVTAVELMIDVRNRSGEVPGDLTLDDFEIFEDGKQVRLLALDYPSTWRPEDAPQALAPEAIHTPDLNRQPWRTLIYIDGSLLSTRSLQRSLKALGKEAHKLVDLGPVEVVLANPLPSVVVPFTLDSTVLENELRQIAQNVQSRDELAELRREFQDVRDAVYNGALVRIKEAELADDGREASGPEGPQGLIMEATTTQIRRFVTRESALIKRQIQVLNDWIDAYGYAPGSVVLVSDGYDLDPRDFYLNTVKNAQLTLVGELMGYRYDVETEDLATDLAAKGWTATILSMNGLRPPDAADATGWNRDRFRSIAENAGNPELGTVNGLITYPLEPLLIAADETGGDVLTTPKAIEEKIGHLGERVRLTYLADRPADGELHDLKVRTTRKGLRVLAPKTVSTPTAGQIAEARARRLLVYEGQQGELPVEVELYPAGKKDNGERPVEVEVTFDLNALQAVLPNPDTPVRFTFGVSMNRSPPFVYQITENVELFTSGDDGEFPDFIYKVILGMPDGAERVSVIVEEPTSGFWGGAVRDARKGTDKDGDTV